MPSARPGPSLLACVPVAATLLRGMHAPRLPAWPGHPVPAPLGARRGPLTPQTSFFLAYAWSLVMFLYGMVLQQPR
jgi:hypothetical protein